MVIISQVNMVVDGITLVVINGKPAMVVTTGILHLDNRHHGRMVVSGKEAPGGAIISGKQENGRLVSGEMVHHGKMVKVTNGKMEVVVNGEMEEVANGQMVDLMVQLQEDHIQTLVTQLVDLQTLLQLEDLLQIMEKQQVDHLQTLLLADHLQTLLQLESHLHKN